METSHSDIKTAMIWAGKVLVSESQDDLTRGHISCRLPEDPSLFLMKPHSADLDQITEDGILTLDLDAKVVAGTAKRYGEVYIHSAIFKARPDVNCVLHAHPPYSVALSVSKRSILPYSQPAALFYKSISLYQDTINPIRSEEMGAAVARALGPHRVVLLKDDGAVTVGATIAETVVSMIMLESAAMIQSIAESHGENLTPFPDEDIEKLRLDLSQPERFQATFDHLISRAQRNLR